MAEINGVGGAEVAGSQGKERPDETGASTETGGSVPGLTGTETPAAEPPVSPGEPVETARPYTKQVHVDRDRRKARLGRKPRAKPTRSTPDKPVKAATYRETPRERKRRDPLRKELAGLIARRDELTRELAQVSDAIGIARIRLEPLPGETRRECFGRFDGRDFDCTSLCPLRPECEVATEERREARVAEGRGA